MNLDIPEIDFKVDARGNVLEIKFAERNPAHRLIETFMIAANEAVAEFLEARNLPCLYRIHETPDPVKLERLDLLFEKFGVKFKLPSNPNPKDLQKLLQQLNQLEDPGFFHSLVLRSMKQAQYSSINKGHFGLASESYCHFTSPIRRYPDLFVHRVLRESEFGELEVHARASFMEELAEECNTTEQRATQADREMEDIKEIRWLESRLGQKFSARIVSVKEFGIFIRLDHVPIEGLIRLENLPHDYWHIDKLETELTGRRTKLVFRLGDALDVQAVAVDRLKRFRDFKYLRHQHPHKQKRP